MGHPLIHHTHLLIGMLGDGNAEFSKLSACARREFAQDPELPFFDLLRLGYVPAEI